MKCVVMGGRDGLAFRPHLVSVGPLSVIMSTVEAGDGRPTIYYAGLMETLRYLLILGLQKPPYLPA
jgi:hypothetical protein